MKSLLLTSAPRTRSREIVEPQACTRRWRPVCLLLALLIGVRAHAQTTSFTYQSRLNGSSSSANANYDMYFKLYDAETGGSQIGATSASTTVVVTNGAFAVQLDFGSTAFPGADRFIETNIRAGGGSGAYTTLTPRQRITSVPYGVQALNAKTATNSLRLGGAAANRFVQTDDVRLPDARPPLAGSSNYIQNTSAPQPSANFSIDGTGTAKVLNAVAQFDIRGTRMLSAGGMHNVFAGAGAGAANSGQANAFFGAGAGASNLTAESNAFFGSDSGSRTTTGGSNVFVGSGAGVANTTGNSNVFLGQAAGETNTTGRNNVFIGIASGGLNPSTQVDNSIAIGSGVTVSASNTVVLGSSTQTTQVPGKLIMQGRVGESFADYLGVSGIIANNLLFRNINNVLASPIPVCIRVVASANGDGGYTFARCTSSLSSASNKTNMQPFSGGLDIINRLKPVSFNWKSDGTGDVGLNAEDVAAVEPLLLMRADETRIDEVKAETLSVVFINAFKEQQAQINAQQELLKRQEREIDALKAIVCPANPRADGCKKEK